MREWLRLKIRKKFQSQWRFAQKCQKSEYWLSCLTTGRTDPSLQDQKLIISVLGAEFAGDPELLFRKEGGDAV